MIVFNHFNFNKSNSVKKTYNNDNCKVRSTSSHRAIKAKRRVLSKKKITKNNKDFLRALGYKL